VSEGAFRGDRRAGRRLCIIKAEDLEEAVLDSLEAPGAHLGEYGGGGIEVRPIATRSPAGGWSASAAGCGCNDPSALSSPRAGSSSINP
jgi:hypothetical protein